MANSVKKFHAEIPFTDPDWPRWQAVEQWHDRTEVKWPSENNVLDHADRYQRFPASRFLTATKGVYTWGWFDGIVAEAIAKKQGFSFGYMTCYADNRQSVLDAGGITLANGATACFPQWLWNEMSAEATYKCWVSPTDNYAIPNGNSAAYKAFLLATNIALNAHITAKGWDGVVKLIDARIIGSWGESHHHPYAPNGDALALPNSGYPTVASLKTLLDSYKNGFPNRQVQFMYNNLDAIYFRNTYVQAEFTQYCLDIENTFGKFGIRQDNVFLTDGYVSDYGPTNNRSYSGGPLFKTQYLARPDIAPLTGECPGYHNDSYADAPRANDERRYSSWGNGNFGVGIPVTNQTIANRLRDAMKKAGSRIKMIDSEISYAASTITVKINWQNVGNAPLYKHDIPLVRIEILNAGGGVVNTFTSTKNLVGHRKEDGVILTTDNFTQTLGNGTYSARLFVADANGYRNNYRLAVQGADASFRYGLGSFDVATTGTPNPGPVVNAGTDKSIQLPQSTVTLNGTVTDDDGFSQIWSKVSGPTGDTIQGATGLNANIIGLKEGAYIYRLTATDTESASNSDDVKVTVLAAVVVPPIDPPVTPPAPKVTKSELYSKITFNDGSSQNIKVTV